MDERCAELTSSLSKETKRANQERARAEQERAKAEDERALRKVQAKRARDEANRADREAAGPAAPRRRKPRRNSGGERLAPGGRRQRARETRWLSKEEGEEHPTRKVNYLDCAIMLLQFCAF
jgi:hypothetical protein